MVRPVGCERGKLQPVQHGECWCAGARASATIILTTYVGQYPINLSQDYSYVIGYTAQICSKSYIRDIHQLSIAWSLAWTGRVVYNPHYDPSRRYEARYASDYISKAIVPRHCPASRTTLVATRFRVAVICPIIQVPHCIRVFFYFVWFVFVNHIFQFYYESCTFCNILDIYLS